MALAKPTMTRTSAAEVQPQVDEAVDATVIQEMAQESQETAEVAENATQGEKPTVATETTADASPRREVAAPVNREVAHPMASINQMATALAAQGFEGFRLDGFSFPTIVLPGEGFFQLNDNEDSNLGKSFVFTPESTRERYIFKETDDKDAESYMSYQVDGLVKTDGTDASAILRQWAADSGEEDYTPCVKPYLDVVALIVEADPSSPEAQELVGETVMLSIPKTSITRFWGTFSRGMRRGEIGSFDIEAGVARKVKTDGGGFYPWAFKLI